MEPSALPPATAPSTRIGFAITALVLGLLAFVLSFALVGAVCGLIGLALGIIHLRRREHARGMAWSGVILCVLGILASGLFAGLYYLAYQKYQQATESGSTAEEWEGVVAPNISVTTLDGSTLALSDLKGKRVILDFWATWCPPCVQEIPHFVRLRQEISTNDLVLIGISDEERDTLEKFIKKHGINYSIGAAKDPPAPYSDIASIPTTYFIDRKGVIQKILVGYHDFDELKEHATAPDFEGDPKSAPTDVAEAGIEASAAESR
jgi:peroxiredoxin